MNTNVGAPMGTNVGSDERGSDPAAEAVVELMERDGEDWLVFRCPACKCSHGVRVRTAGDAHRWEWNGSLTRPTLTPSLVIDYDPAPPPDRPGRCHLFVIDGQIQYLADSLHTMRGQTIPMVPVND